MSRRLVKQTAEGLQCDLKELDEILKKLKSYEDTGLEPETINSFKNFTYLYDGLNLKPEEMIFLLKLGLKSKCCFNCERLRHGPNNFPYCAKGCYMNTYGDGKHCIHFKRKNLEDELLKLKNYFYDK